MNDQPEILEAVVAALREAQFVAHYWTDEQFPIAATALLRDLARLQRPVAWRFADRCGPWHDGSTLTKSDAAKGVELAYPALPGGEKS